MFPNGVQGDPSNTKVTWQSSNSNWISGNVSASGGLTLYRERKLRWGTKWREVKEDSILVNRAERKVKTKQKFWESKTEGNTKRQKNAMIDFG